MKQWYSTELEKELAGRFKEYCRDMHLQYEASEADNLIHFEVHASEPEMLAANNWLNNL